MALARPSGLVYASRREQGPCQCQTPAKAPDARCSAGAFLFVFGVDFGSVFGDNFDIDEMQVKAKNGNVFKFRLNNIRRGAWVVETIEVNGERCFTYTNPYDNEKAARAGAKDFAERAINDALRMVYRPLSVALLSSDGVQEYRRACGNERLRLSAEPR